ncbi:alanine racemase [Sulfuricella sp. T08]|uniref:alanine racemase n=1 Tax=Sulfuricella sp. T08 TaxID=1632857 RepID=UPI00061798E4|nr:alanine racemase [Sulfuricella sp. T08]GAO35534.1 alanine racemase [Sulfuricella sp. T08]
MRPLQAKINLSALKHNFGVVRGHAPQSRTIAVIKANGYGHGMLRVARALEAAEGYAVLNVGEAVALREAGFKQAILLLEGFFSADELPTLAEHRLASVIHCQEQIEMLEMAGLPVKINVFLKLNSGMNRLGFRPEAFGAALQRLQAARSVGQITLMTHFACADEVQGIAAQLACFDRLATGLDAPRSLANSAAILRFPQAHGDWVRPGIMLYGSSPFADTSAVSLDLKPVMTLTSAIIGLQDLPAGEAVGYGATFRAEQPTRAGIVACGYADGYPRHAPTGTPVLVNGQRSRILGRVSMDMLCVDLTGISGAGIGSPVVLWGEGLPVEEIAAAAGTISYELLCALAARVPVVEV